MKNRNLILFIFLLWLNQITFAQNFSNSGKDFWLCFPSHVPNQRNGVTFYAKMSLFISAEKSSSGIVSIPGKFNAPFSVVPGQVTEIDIPYSLAHIDASEAGTVQQKGIRIKTDLGKPSIIVYAQMYAGFRSAATLLLPVPVLGKKYYSVNALQVSTGNSKSQFTIVATEPNTFVKINPVKNGITAAPFTVSLPQAGDVFEVQDDKDLSGSFIESISSGTEVCKKIAVFSGSSAISINSQGGTCTGTDSYDPLYQQLYPVNSWGKKYGFIPFENYPNGNPYRIIASENNTVISINGTPVATLNAGEYYPANNNFGITEKKSVFITGDKPVCVTQYMQRSGCSGYPDQGGGKGYGDPDMVVLNPLEQNINNITIFSSQKENIYSNTKFLNILIANNAAGSFKINGLTPTVTWQPMLPQNSGFSFAKIRLPENESSFTLNADSSFNAIIYGYGDFESYAYSAGTNVKDLSRIVTIENEFGKANFPASCRNTRFKILATYPYLTNKITWKFNGVFPDEVVKNPLPVESFMLNNKLVYRYKLEKEYQISNKGEYDFSVVANNPDVDGCLGEDEIEYKLEIIDRPVALFNYTHNGCITDDVVFNEKSDTSIRANLEWHWQFGDNISSADISPLHKYNNGGEYNIRHWNINNIGCISDTAIQKINVSEVPEAKFSVPIILCKEKDIVFNDLSTIASNGVIIEWSWDFGDGTKQISTNNLPLVHKYAIAGDYKISLSVRSASGCISKLFTQTITIHPNPFVSFKIPSFCLPSGQGQFVNTSSITDNSETQFRYEWDFGDGTALSRDIDPVHRYIDEGAYVVKLKVISQDGCTADSASTIKTIFPLTHINANFSSMKCVGENVVVKISPSSTENTLFSNIYVSEDINGPFKDSVINNTASSINFSVNYKSSGNKVIALFGRSALTGCSSDTITKVVYINELPVADFLVPGKLCDMDTVHFTNKSVAKDGMITKWKWEFGNNNINSEQNPDQVFAAGMHQVSLYVETDLGCKSTLQSKLLKIFNLPFADFNNSQQCLSDPFVQFSDKSIDKDNSALPLFYNWSFGDLNLGESKQQDPSYKFNDIGNYFVKLNIKSANGCSAGTTKKITVNGNKPEASFIINNSASLCSNTAVVVKDNSTIDFGKIIKIEIYWDFENAPQQKYVDDAPYTGKTYTHNYPVFYGGEKKYTIKYVIYSGLSCSSEMTQTALIKGLPKLSFNAIQDVCLNSQPFIISEANELSGMIGKGVYSGIGTFSDGAFYPAMAGIGNNRITYTYKNQDGCVSSITQNIKILPALIADAGPDRFINEGDSVKLTGNNSSANLNYKWTPAENINDIKANQPLVWPNINTTYHLIISSVNGCIASDDVDVKVKKDIQIPNAFSPNGDGLNDYWGIKYIEAYPKCRIEVFSRNGQKVFESSGLYQPWDGKFNGQALSIGSYSYIINIDGRRKIGYVLIIR